MHLEHLLCVRKGLMFYAYRFILIFKRINWDEWTYSLYFTFFPFYLIYWGDTGSQIHTCFRCTVPQHVCAFVCLSKAFPPFIIHPLYSLPHLSPTSPPFLAAMDNHRTIVPVYEFLLLYKRAYWVPSKWLFKEAQA